MSKTLFKRRLEREAFGTFPLALPFVHTAMYPVQSPAPCVWCGRENMRYPTDKNLHHCDGDMCRLSTTAIDYFRQSLMAAKQYGVIRGWDLEEVLRDHLDDMCRSLFLEYEKQLPQSDHRAKQAREYRRM